MAVPGHFKTVLDLVTRRGLYTGTNVEKYPDLKGKIIM